MKITKQFLKKVIKEELSKVLNEETVRFVSWQDVIDAHTKVGEEGTAARVQRSMNTYGLRPDDVLELKGDMLYHKGGNNYMQINPGVVKALSSF